MKKILFLFIGLISVFCFVDNIFGLENGNNLIIKIKDNEYKDVILEKIKGKKFWLYKDRLGYKTINFDETDTIIYYNLDYGEYVFKPEIIEGYKTDYYEYRVMIHELSEENNYIYINYEPIKGNLIINKYFGSENNYNLDNNSVFELYKDNILIKQLKPTNGIIKETLEYGTYLVKQVSGEKYYALSEEFTIDISEEKSYQYNLYSEIDSSLEQAFTEKEEILNRKEQELLELEKKLKVKESEFISLEKEIENKNNEIKKLQEQIKQKEEKLNINNANIIELKNNIDELKKELNNNINLLEKEKSNILDKENIIKKLEEELCLIKKGKEIVVQTNLIEEPLIVDVPNTNKKSFNISLLLTLAGSIIILLGIKKVTNH